MNSSTRHLGCRTSHRKLLAAQTIWTLATVVALSVGLALALRSAASSPGAEGKDLARLRPSQAAHPSRAARPSRTVPPPPAVPPRWNVLLFTIDSCNASRMSLYGNPLKTTPNIDRWAEQGTVFDQAYAVSAWTAPGLVSLLSGTLPGVHGVDSRDRHASPALPTLLKSFGAQGYEVPNLNFFTFAPYYQNLGLPALDRSYFTEQDGDELINYLDRKGSQPFFVWYHTTKVHQPYDPPSDVLQKMLEMHGRPSGRRGAAGAPGAAQGKVGPRGKQSWEEALKAPGIAAVRHGAIVPRGSVEFKADDSPALHALYDGEIYNMDLFFGRVLDKLRQLALEERTLVVVTADHGEELLEHGFVGHASTSLNARLFEEVTRIPLIVRLPGEQVGTRVSGMVQQIDVAPTILDLLQLPAPDVMQGRSLKPQLAGNIRNRNAGPKSSGSAGGSRAAGSVIRSELFLESVIAGNQTTKERENVWLRGIRTAQAKYVQESHGSNVVTESLFDLRKDPLERNNLASLRPSNVRSFREKVARFRAGNEAWRGRHIAPDPAPVAPAAPTGQCPVLLMPEPDQSLDYHLHTGAMLFQWKGEADADYQIEYDIGEGDHHVAGQYDAKGNYQVLGPFPPELWISLKAWNPFKIRVAPKETDCWSDWRTFYF